MLVRLRRYRLTFSNRCAPITNLCSNNVALLRFSQQEKLAVTLNDETTFESHLEMVAKSRSQSIEVLGDSLISGHSIAIFHYQTTASAGILITRL